ncbi:MAG: dihydroorotase [Actinomycetota bacterium]
MNDIVIVGGSVLTADGIESVDIGIADGKVAEIGKDLKGTRVIDATDSWVGPSFVDVHTHLREPGFEWKETIATGTEAAAAGGYGAVVAMPNTDPVTDNAQIAMYVAQRGTEAGFTDVMPAGAITMGRAGEKMAHIDEMWGAGVRVFTDDGDSVEDAAVLRLAMEYIANLGGVVSQHAVDANLSRHGFMHEGSVSSLLGMAGIPAEAEEIVIARDLALVRLTGVRYHVQHVATRRGVELIAQAKQDGLAVTAEATPHHLMFDDTFVATMDPDYKMMPPLRSPSDRAALREGLISGVIDVVGTDHAPHAPREQEVPFEHAPNGVIGLEWAASVASDVIGDDQARFFAAMSQIPAEIAGIPGHGNALEVGADANVVVFDPTMEWTATRTRSMSRNAPYLGSTLRGKVMATILRGSVTYSDAS